MAVDDEVRDQGTRAEIVNRLLEGHPKEAINIAKWLTDHDADVQALYLREESIKGVAGVLGMSYQSVARWFRLDADNPSRKGLSGPSETPMNYGAATSRPAMEDLKRPEPLHQPEIARENYMQFPVLDPAHTTTVSNGGGSPDLYQEIVMPADPIQPSEHAEVETITLPFQCDHCDAAPFQNTQGLGSHKYSAHGIRSEGPKRPEGAAERVMRRAARNDDYAMMMYWKGKYDGLAEALPKFLKAAWEMPE
jgi:hypothetical protein